MQPTAQHVEHTYVQGTGRLEVPFVSVVYEQGALTEATPAARAECGSSAGLWLTPVVV